MCGRAVAIQYDLISCNASAEFLLVFVQHIPILPTRFRARGLLKLRFDFVQSIRHRLIHWVPCRRLLVWTTISCICFWSWTHISCGAARFKNRQSFVLFGQDSHEFFITFYNPLYAEEGRDFTWIIDSLCTEQSRISAKFIDSEHRLSTIYACTMRSRNPVKLHRFSNLLSSAAKRVHIR